MFTILAIAGVLNGGLVIACYLRGTTWRRTFEKKHMPELYIKNNPQLADAEVHDEKLNFEPTVDEKDNSQIERVLSHHSACIV
jgi:hypothetical protein